MCGLTGFWSMSPAKRPDGGLAHTAKAMSDRIIWRGPDSDGIWTDEEAGLALAHRRLAIVDLSPAGYQPMASASGRFVICYNGEIYNSTDIRKELAGRDIAWRGHSDTETMVEACETFGVAEAVKRFIGMFAFALWDRQERTLWLVRDRLGIKPMHYGLLEDTLFFGSQLRTFTPHPGFSPQQDMDAVRAYARYGYIPAPLTIWQGVRKLMPGHIARITADGDITETPYWSMAEVAANGQANRFSGSPEEAVDELEKLLMDAVGRRMMADVPLGAFLSGGVDSSLVCALMQAQSDKPVKTFSIGFDEDGYNEAPYAREVAKHLGTEHHEFYVRPEEAQAIIPGIPEWYDEPFSDSSQIPTTLVSRLARKEVIVALSGDGGDELFAGYRRYNDGLSIWRKFQAFPPIARKAAIAGIHALSPTWWDRVARLVPPSLRPAHVGCRAYKLADVLAESGTHAFYRSLISQWHDINTLIPGAPEPLLPPWNNIDAMQGSIPDVVERMQYLDTITYMPDDILVKADRASMSCSLELRVPLIDHRVVEMAWRMPPELKMRGGVSKWPLREVLYRHVPKELIERPKMGFGVPIDHWLRGSLRDWAENLLSEKRLREEGIFNPAPIRARWQQHLEGSSNWQYPLWTILMFEAWHEAQKV
ncbi:MAG TPA: asparagine synthase (glutamine-hydrolyzing) [Rhodospirillaceae bacterium]|nr:MAG: asparagine synthase (glutamine-hydrolyzing) [Alphaproteobacteria bacterium GWF2_58_20]HAU29567.1 asparagine synthase (glutamine-hydrolyzing) [Rhodospirillaceae bacterium]